MTQDDAEKIREFVYDESDEIQNPILLVGDIPNPEDYDSDPCGTLGCYECMDGIDIYPWNYELIDGDYFAAYPAVDVEGHFYLDGDDSNYQTMDVDVIRQALLNARRARFEHGERPYLR
jgi:hypothetical protein